MDCLTGFSDTDWAGCQETSKSSGCGLLFWAGGLIHFHSRTQGYPTLSSPEAEYGGAVSKASVMMFAISMLAFLGYTVCATMYLDASSAIAICKRQGVGRVKHLNNKLLLLQRVVEEKIIQILKLFSSFLQTFVNMGPFPIKGTGSIESIGIELVHVLLSANEKIDFEN